MKQAYREADQVIIKWDSEASNLLGFRVVYRLFGDAKFTEGVPLAASEREFTIKGVPTQVSFPKIYCFLYCVLRRRYLFANS